jgi:cyclohexa-1,5-dienecarbonyl-CoA hydratase
MSAAVIASSARICGGIAAVIEIGPPPGNVLTRAAVAALRSELAGLATDPGLKAVVLRGAGAHFSYGASVPEHLPGEVEAMLPEFHALLRSLDELPLPPLVAQARGLCLGGGFELALACDFIAAASDAEFGCPEIRLGVFPPAAAVLLPLRLPASRAAELVLTGRRIRGDEAHATGLAELVAPSAELDAALESWINLRLGTLSATALRQARRAARWPWRRVWAEELPRVERQYLDELMATQDAREGLNAFLGKRSPQWSNR